MRPVLHSDLVAVSRALHAVPEARRGGVCRVILAQARWADAYRAALGRAHPDWGDGSLAAAAACHPQSREPFLSDPEYLHCLWVLVTVLLRRAGRHQGKKMPLADL